MDTEASTSQSATESSDVKENIDVNDEIGEILEGNNGDEGNDDDEDDEDDEDVEYEETYLYVDFETKLLEEQLMNPNLQIRVLGIDTDAPIVQLNNKIFKGVYEYAMATMLFLNETTHPPEPDPNFQEPPRRTFQYLAQSDKVLKMKRIFIEEIGAVDEEEILLAEGEVANLEHLRVTKTYEDALNQFLLPDEKPPREFAKPSTDGDPSKDENTSEPMESSSVPDPTNSIEFAIASRLLEDSAEHMEVDAAVDAEIASNLEQLLKDSDDIPSS